MPSANDQQQPLDDDFDVDSIDFSDLEAQFKVSAQSDFQHVIVIDGIPAVEETREAKLISVICKIFKSIDGGILSDKVFMPKDPKTNKTKGYAFVECASAEAAKLAVALGNGFKMDKAHTLSVIMFDDMEDIANIPDAFVAPPEEVFQPKEHLNSWLTDPRCRDQWAMIKSDDVTVCWNNKTEKPDKAESRSKWTDSYISWSPQGKFLVTVHSPGIALWGGPSWKKIVRFEHPHVKMIDFSPNEKYAVTWSHEPFKSQDGQKQNFIVWDVDTGLQLRTFGGEGVGISSQEARSGPAATVMIDWPLFKWSHDSEYIARMTPGAQGAISVYQLPDMGLLDKKSIKVENLQSFDWSPSSNTLSFWTPEIGDIPARVTLMSVPSRKVIRTKNLFGVTDCKMSWQNGGMYLLVQVTRLKSKKHSVTSFEVFRMLEKDIPVDVVEHKQSEEVMSTYWEPLGNRFAVLSTELQKTFINFYQVELLSSSSANIGTKIVKTQEVKGINQVHWSPKGRFCVLAGVRGMQGDLQFWDVDELLIRNTGEHYMCTDIEWDPTGRYVVSSISMWRVQSDHGFIMWNFAGQQLTKQNVNQFKQFAWRPRPKSLLTPARQKAITKNLKKYSVDFDRQDALETNKVSLEVQEERMALWAEWAAYRKACQDKYSADRPERIKLYGGIDPDLSRRDTENVEELEEWVEEIIDETDEIIE
ncbi:hypothetical protein BASA50_002362 [Batrachochytrium salamandrivorans]|uniref:Eukaryotic translation initiation factor 3 subunit B n=1 Tax=Batrachochytrium salamandrivorans TaxID=1357716 RepID=A0ABQ8FPD9_9FUNG|nr:hypothetical protein BASA60_010752 [Batrachochytrium salamandrivorans]KAH6580045.1 hypothetical protein BASA61_009857 [Batrachochytrium salamandrivorans]KAH6600351.1 hypothetical protein BASA50_002362 [Batrachochytrium salamandrivorans]KAH9268842.1 hypothetical protein BASA83_009130 [Batrachochytrium salamandrivorans]